MKKQKKNRGHSNVKAYWYVEVSSYTNKFVAEYLTGIGKQSENCYSSIPDECGNPHQVWEVPREFIHEMEKATLNDPNISFTVYTRPSTAETIRAWPFARMPRRQENKPKPKDDPVVMSAEQQLKHILDVKYRKKKSAPK
ncbi:MAG: hypothetical protein NTW66_00535 [Candidatus Magasanikbacteria bacterium]|nr:hypothetical protein [Candidatus Magasanikbacteria bacterium]